MIDSAGHLMIVGNIAHDAADAGHPVKIGGKAVAALPSAVSNADRVNALFDNRGRLVTVPYIPGASEVLSVRLRAAASSTRATVLTPTSGKAIRIISIEVNYDNTSGLLIEVYFGTGANIGTNAGKEISEGVYDRDDFHNHRVSWPDGGGPVGAVDDVLSIRSTVATGNTGIIVHYREE